jgi:hypothetical protein
MRFISLIYREGGAVNSSEAEERATRIPGTKYLNSISFTAHRCHDPISQRLVLLRNSALVANGKYRERMEKII